jgi:hypothetical protein
MSCNFEFTLSSNEPVTQPPKDFLRGVQLGVEIGLSARWSFYKSW